MTANVASTNPIARLFKPDLSRDLFRVLADTTDDSLIVLSGDAGRLLTCNHAFLLLSEAGSKDICSERFLSLTNPSMDLL